MSVTVRRLATLVVIALVSACGNDGAETAASPDDLIHVHDVLVGPGGSPVYLAAHTGLYELRDGELAWQSDRFDDLMAAALEADGSIIASGHPDLTDKSLRVDDKPPLLGLVESDDGVSWTPRSLLGDADFHALVVVDDRIFGADSTSARVLVSDDRGLTWTSTTGSAQLLDLAVDPADSDRMIGVDFDRGMVATDDGARTWQPVTSSPELVDIEWTNESLVGIDANGTVHHSKDRGQSWQETASLSGATALGADHGTLYAYVKPAALLVSTDGGVTWDETDG